MLNTVIVPAPEVAPDSVYVFMDVHPEALLAPVVRESLRDSRWEIPFFRYKANYSSKRNPLFQTNSLGLRNPEIASPKPDGVFRILCIGGSTTDDIDEEDDFGKTYPPRLQELFNDAVNGLVVEVINAGTPAIASKGHLLRFHDYMLVEPDMVVIHLGVNDTLTLCFWHHLTNNLPVLYSSLVRHFWPLLTLPSPAVFEQMLEESFGVNLMLLTELFKRSGVMVAYASMPVPAPELVGREYRQYFDYLGNRVWNLPSFSFRRYASFINSSNCMLKSMSQQHQAVYIPVAERMRLCREVYTDFCHMNQAGMNAKAEVIFDSIFPVVKKWLHMKKGD